MLQLGHTYTCHAVDSNTSLAVKYSAASTAMHSTATTCHGGRLAHALHCFLKHALKSELLLNSKHMLNHDIHAAAPWHQAARSSKPLEVLVPLPQ